LLTFAIPFNRFRMLRPVVRKIVGMSLAPLLLAVVGDLAIFRICFELFSVIVGTSPVLVGASDPPEPAGKDAVRTLN